MTFKFSIHPLLLTASLLSSSFAWAQLSPLTQPPLQGNFPRLTYPTSNSSSGPVFSGSSSAVMGSAGALNSTSSMDALDDKRALVRGDRLSYRVVEEQRPAVQVMVTDSGEVEAPLIGRVPAEGKTCKQLAVEIKKLLEKSYFYKATVIVGLDIISELPRGTVYLTGNVKTQGALILPPRESITASQAIFRAGGFADFANPKRVKVIRRLSPTETKTIIVDVSKIISKGEVAHDPVLMPDDVIVVSEKVINF